MAESSAMEKMNRRSFLGKAVVSTVAAGTLVIATQPSDTQERLVHLGLIGCGGYGRQDVRAAFRAGGVDVVAICDVDSEHLASSAAEIEKLQGTRPKTFKHYQEMLDASGPEAVIIATPPHWHAIHFLAALDKGLDVYCEKPLSYDVREGRAMVEAAKASGRIVQIGFQRRQSAAIRRAREHIRQGDIGRVVQVDVQIHYTAVMRDAKPQEPPTSLDWDLWCGPAPKLPYSPQIGHVSWRLEKEYGHGHLVDWGIHMIDAVRWILGETMPRTLQAAGGIYYFKGQITTPDVLTVHLDFATCPVTWRHHIWGAEEYSPEVSNGIFLYGEKGTVFVADDRCVIIPKGKERTEQRVNVDMAKEHVGQFLQAVRIREQPLCTPQEAYYSTATVQLAMIAYETGSTITWDAQSEQIVGNAEANKLLKREYRSPWKHPYQG